MYFTKKSKVAVLLVVLLVLIASTFLIKVTGITGAVVVEPESVDTQELNPQATTLTVCGQLNLSGEVYTLGNDVSASVTNCFDIVAPSVTLDCNKFMITYNTGAGSTVAINDTDGFDNVHILNCNIREAAGRSQGAIFLVGVDNATIENSNITVVGTDSNGIVLDDSNGNLVINNNISVTAVLGGSGIVINGTATNNVLTNNNITVNGVGSPSSYDIFHSNLRQNSLIYSNPFGAIIWNKTNFTTGVDLSVGLNVFLNNNSIGILDLAAGSSTAIAYNINSTAQIEIRNLTYQIQPDLLKNGVRCDNSSDVGIDCNITYDASLGILYANVTGFSNYSTQENDPPRVTILAPTNGSNYSFTIQDFNASVADNHSFVDTVIFVFTNGSNPFNLTASNNSITARLWNVTRVNLTLFSEGNHNFRVFANDTYNNVNYTESINFIVDRSAPLVNSFWLNYTGPTQNNNTNHSIAIIRFNATVNDTTLTTQEVRFGFYNGNTSGFNVSGIHDQAGVWSANISTSSLSDAIYTVLISANDTVDNRNNTIANLTFTSDRTAPFISAFWMNASNASNFSSSLVSILYFNATVNDTTLSTQEVRFGFYNGNASGFNITGFKNVAGVWTANVTAAAMSDGVYTVILSANDTVDNRNN